VATPYSFIAIKVNELPQYSSNAMPEIIP